MDLNHTDRLILAKLQEGRMTPGYLASELDKQQPYINQRLKPLVEAGVVVRLHRGLYGHAALESTPVDAEGHASAATDRMLLDGECGHDTPPSRPHDAVSAHDRAGQPASETGRNAATQADEAPAPDEEASIYDPTRESQ